MRCRLSTKEPTKENEDPTKVKIGMRNAGKRWKGWRKKTRGRRAAASKEEKGKKRVARENPEHVGRATRQVTMQLCTKGNTNLYAVDEDGENAEKSTENEEDLPAWCLLEESKSEHWQEVISKQNKRKVKKANKASLLSTENCHNPNPKIVEVKEKWVEVRATMDSGAAGHVMPKRCFHVPSLSETTIPSKRNEGIQRCITFRSANVAKPFISMQKVVRAGITVVLDEKNPHIRNIRDVTVIRLDVSNGVRTMDLWTCLDETGPVFSAGRSTEWSSRFRQACNASSIVQRCNDRKQKSRVKKQNWMEL